MPRRIVPIALAAFVLLASTTAAQGAPPAPPDSAPPPIEDNSFLVEEAYNQDRGIVQHINTFQHGTMGRGWAYTLTQEWPAPNIRHQLSYTIPLTRPDERGASPRLGDVALNYRYQAVDRNGVLFAPRITALVPTGSARHGTGAGGTGIQGNLPLTLELSPHWSTHTNVGGTIVPRGETDDGERARMRNLMLAQSVIWLAKPTFNLMLESLWSRTTTRPAASPIGGAIDDAIDQSFTISPGFRYAMNFRSGLQIVPGLAVPIEITGHSGAFDSEKSVFLYLSFEHRFRPER